MTDIGLALSGGGAKGLAHVLMLEALDEVGVRPCKIAGTSIGAVIGVMYAAGMKGFEIRKLILRQMPNGDDSLRDVWRNKELRRWLDYINFEFKHGAVFKADQFVADLLRELSVSRFEELDIPLKVVATDFWQRRQVVLDEGELMPAVHASMALPGIFKPVVRDKQVLMDGSAVNPVPYDLLQQDCAKVIAIDVMGTRTESEELVPSFTDAIFNTFQIMQKTIVEQKLKVHAPDIYITPDIVDIRALEFYRAEEIFAQAQPAKETLKRKLDQLLKGRG